MSAQPEVEAERHAHAAEVYRNGALEAQSDALHFARRAEDAATSADAAAAEAAEARDAAEAALAEVRRLLAS